MELSVLSQKAASASAALLIQDAPGKALAWLSVSGIESAHRFKFSVAGWGMPRTDFSLHDGQLPRLGNVAGLRVREDVLFADAQGKERPATKRRAEQALSHVSVLQRLLQPDEVILFVAPMLAPASFLEQLTFGWFISFVCRMAMVVTNRRVFILMLDMSGNWNRRLRSAPLSAIQTAKATGFLGERLRLEYRDGRRETFWGVKRADLRALELLFSKLLPAAEPGSQAAPVNLCPECMTPLTAGVYRCAQCGLVFKDAHTMVRRALLIPGGAYFYGGQPMLGILHFLGDAAITVFLLDGLLLFVSAIASGKTADLGFAVFLVATMGGFLALHKYLSIRHGRRFIAEFIPTDDAARKPGAMGTSATGASAR